MCQQSCGRGSVSGKRCFCVVGLLQVVDVCCCMFGNHVFVAELLCDVGAGAAYNEPVFQTLCLSRKCL